MKLFRWFKEPWFINFLQCVGYGLAFVCGVLAATGGLQNIVTFQLGSLLSVVIGSMLAVGGLVGMFAVARGIWILEQIVIWIVGLGYGGLLIPTFAMAITPGKSSALWLIVALEIAAIIDSMKRYRRIDWAYLDPAK